MKKSAVIITIGDELLIGQVTDTNSAWLASELTLSGFSVVNHLSVSDKRTDIIEALDLYISKSDLVIFTGGLGPTNDDITKKVLADYFDSSLVTDRDVLKEVEEFLTVRGVAMNKLNNDQALVPEKATVLRNKQGTAPGMWFENDGKVVISLPGVPYEVKGIYADHIKEKLKEYFSLPQIVYRTVMLTGIGESTLAEKISQWECGLPKEMSLAYLPSPGTVRLRLGLTSANREEALKSINMQIENLRSIVPEHIFGYDNITMEEVVGNLIAKRNSTIAVAESCTGGTLAQMITAIPGCSGWFSGGVVAYSNDVKTNVLGVNPDDILKHGAVSQSVVEQMAAGVKNAMGADYAIATSGIAGPGGGTPDKPVGTVWIAVAGPDFVKSQLFHFGSERKGNIRRSSLAAFNMMRLALL